MEAFDLDSLATAIGGAIWPQGEWFTHPGASDANRADYRRAHETGIAAARALLTGRVSEARALAERADDYWHSANPALVTDPAANWETLKKRADITTEAGIKAERWLRLNLMRP